MKNVINYESIVFGDIEFMDFDDIYVPGGNDGQKTNKYREYEQYIHRLLNDGYSDIDIKGKVFNGYIYGNGVKPSHCSAIRLAIESYFGEVFSDYSYKVVSEEDMNQDDEFIGVNFFECIYNVG